MEYMNVIDFTSCRILDQPDLAAAVLGSPPDFLGSWCLSVAGIWNVVLIKLFQKKEARDVSPSPCPQLFIRWILTANSHQNIYTTHLLLGAQKPV